MIESVRVGRAYAQEKRLRRGGKGDGTGVCMCVCVAKGWGKRGWGGAEFGTEWKEHHDE